MKPYEMFIKHFQAKVDSKKKIGLEIEIPIVTKTGEAVDYALIRQLFRYLKKEGFELQKDNDLTFEANIYTTIVDHYPITITTDLGYSTLEIILPPCNDLYAANQCFMIAIDYLLPFVKEQNCRLLGYGVHPLAHPTRRLLAPKQRYQALEKIWNTNIVIPKSMGSDGHLLTISAGNQCHIDVSDEDAIRVTNMLNASCGLQIALQANSPIWKGQIAKNYKAIREKFYDFICADKVHRRGVAPKFESLADYFQFVTNQSLFLVIRDGEILKIMDYTFAAFLEQKTVEAVKANGEKVTVIPHASDIHYHNTLFYLNTRLVSTYGTVEVRMPCQQPPNETMVTAALNLGLVENLTEAEALFNQYDWSVWQELRTEAIHYAFDAKLSNGESIIPLIKQLLEIAKKGLEKRNLNEMVFLNPLFERLEKRQSPADIAVQVFNKKGMNGLLDAVSFTEKHGLKNLNNQYKTQNLTNI